MLRKKFIIPMVAIMSVASSGSVFASEKAVDNNKVIYREAEVTAKSGLNVRETPAIENGNKIFAVPIGTELDIIGKENDWFKVKLQNDKEAYINSNYVKVNNNDLYVNVDRLNFREAPGTDKKIYDVLTKGTKIEFLDESGDWVKVKVNNTTGYVHSDYINNEKPVVESNKETTTSSKKEETNTSTVKPNKDAEDKVTENKTENKTNENKTENKTEVSKDESSNKEETNKPSVEKEEVKEDSKKEEASTSESKPSTSKPVEKPSNPSTSKPSENTDKEESEKPSSSKNVQAVINLAYDQVGKPYNWGSEGPNSFDCSGLMRYIYQNGAGVNLPRTSKAQSQYGTTVSRSNLKPGDLIFSSTDGSGTVSHVGIYIGGGQMIHAPKPGDVVKISSINSSYWNDAYLWAKRVM